MSVTCYRDLNVWQKAMDLVVICYRVCEQFPRTEMYGLCSQLQRAAVSVPANIAEGHGRQSTREYLHHVSISYGSLMELETHVAIAQRLGYISENSTKPLFDLTREVGRMLNGLMQSLRQKLSSNP